jgi:outer membrane protein assembly factor BamC
LTGEYLKRIATLSVAILTASCGLFGGDQRPAYQKSDQIRPLEVPPDLTAPPLDSRMAVPPLRATRARVTQIASQEEPMLARTTDRRGSTSAPAPLVLPEFAQMQLRRQGGIRWLAVQADPGALWASLKGFLRQSGLPLARAKPRLGVMQTAWINPRAPGLIAADLKDSFRLRLEREDADTTNVYISHRGAARSAASRASGWEMRPSDPELEAEYLTRLMVYLGETRQQAERQVALAEDGATAMRLDQVAGIPVLVIEEGFGRVWQLTGVALDRAGLPVEEGDVAKGAYYFRYHAAASGRPKGVLTGIPGASSDEALSENARYQVHLLDQPGQTLITAHTAAREALPAAAAEEILERLIASMQGTTQYPETLRTQAARLTTHNAR